MNMNLTKLLLYDNLIICQISENIHYSCSGRNLSSIPNHFSPMVEILDLSFNFLSFLNKTTVPLFSNLQVLDLTRCHIQHIDDDAFHNVRNLTTLILTGNPISYTGPNVLNALTKLQRLVLVDIGLLSLELPIHSLMNLQELKVGTNNIKSMAMPPYMISFKDFRLLDLHANNISLIKADHTSVLREIGRNMTLILSRNPILCIESGAFQHIYLRELNIQGAFVSFNATRNGLKSLTGLNVDRLVIGDFRDKNKSFIFDVNFLSSLSSIGFQEIYYYVKERPAKPLHLFEHMVNASKITVKHAYIPYLEYVPYRQIKELFLVDDHLFLSIEFSHQHTIEKLVISNSKEPVIISKFTDLPKLHYVDLSKNQITLKECCNTIFIEIPQLRFLNFSLNAEIRLALTSFSGLNNLEVLDFHYTKVAGIGNFAVLANLKLLRYLDISYSSITFTCYMSFYGLDSLRVLKVAGNSFKLGTSQYLFANLTQLELLDISNCGIESMMYSTFKDLHQLKHLFLSGNKLMTLDFSSLKAIRNVYVDNNQIASIPLNVLQNRPENLSVFDLSNNPIDCSCSQTDFISWIVNHQQILKQPQNIFCHSLSRTPVTRVIDFDLENCAYRKKAAVVVIVVSLFVVLSLLLVSVLTYKFQFYLRYCCILLRGYRASRQQECPYDAFVIYSSKDEAWVMDELVENLEKGVPPIQLCLHVRDFEVGKSITSNIIDEGIMGSHKVIVVVSRHFIDSVWCRFEFEVAQSWLVMEGTANIIIIMLEDVEEEKTKKVFGLHKHLKKNTYLKWRGNPLSDMRFWIRLRRAVIAKK
ncbi:toll-like receptor 4 [Chanos chanos]|uniref:Toll-like receptor 4 n=1 Tax=Chanos chanos TaxID=29144 RepID=A0A6J2VAI7_CHACN|nr:toll-like receptor 4 [Chanos chanos]